MITSIEQNLPYNLTYDDPYPFDMEVFPYNRYNRIHRRKLNQNIGLLSALGPHFSHLGIVHDAEEDFGHVSSKRGFIMDKDHDFHVHLDVGLFAPKELTVKVVDDFLVIDGHHKERQAEDIGFVARHFIRRYKLPKDYDPDAIVSELSSDNVLSVMLPKTNNKQKEHIVPIQQPGQNDIFLKKYKADKAKNQVEKEEEEKINKSKE